MSKIHRTIFITQLKFRRIVLVQDKLEDKKDMFH